MPCTRISMHKTREILRLKFHQGLTNRQIAQSCRVSPSSVWECLHRASVAGLSWPLPEGLGDEELEERLYPRVDPARARIEPDWREVFRELRKKGVTLMLLWQEYKATHPDDGYEYSSYCKRYKDWKKSLEVVMHIEHRGGESMFLDYAGPEVPVKNPKTGEITMHPVFVAALGASQKTFAEVHGAQSSECWIVGNIHACEFFCGVARRWIPDNLKAGVTKPHYYEPDINRSYGELAKHYGAVILPARVRKPRDKAKVENAVQQVERWVLAPLRKQTFFSIAEWNEAIRERLDWLNNRKLSKIDGTRESLYQEIDAPALGPLPTTRYEVALWKPNVTVQANHHAEYDGHFYSVPHRFVGRIITVRATKTTIECLLGESRIASHRRSSERGRYTTVPEHRPKAHQNAQWSPERMRRWAETIGPNTAKLAEEVMANRRYPEHGYRSCLGILRLGKRYGNDRLEAASCRALRLRSYSYKSVHSILKAGLDKEPLRPAPKPIAPIFHEHIRGADYYQNERTNKPCSTNKPSTESTK